MATKTIFYPTRLQRSKRASDPDLRADRFMAAGTAATGCSSRPPPNSSRRTPTTTVDLYARESGQYTLIPGSFPGMSRDGSRVFFLTSAQLVPEDTDTTPDIYVRDGSYTELITGGLMWDAAGWGFVGLSRDAGRASSRGSYGTSNRCLFSHPIYSNTTTNTGLCAPNSHGPSWKVDTEGSHACSIRSSSLLPGDADSAQDVYAANLVPPAGYPGPRAPPPCACPWCRHSHPARAPTRPTAHRSPSGRAAHPRRGLRERLHRRERRNIARQVDRLGDRQGPPRDRGCARRCRRVSSTSRSRT